MKQRALRWLCALLAAGVLAAGLPTAAFAEDSATPTPTATAAVTPEQDAQNKQDEQGATPTPTPTATATATATVTDEQEDEGETPTPTPTATATATVTDEQEDEAGTAPTPTPTATAPLPGVQRAPAAGVTEPEDELTPEEIAALTSGMIMTLSSPDHSDTDILTGITAQLNAINDASLAIPGATKERYWNAFKQSTGISYTSGGSAMGTLRWSTPSADCSEAWDGSTEEVIPDESGVYHIYNAKQLAWVMRGFGKASSFLQAKAVLEKDIDLNGQNYYWTAGNMNKGGQTLGGNGHTIYNLCVNGGSNAGFVTQIGGTSTISDLTFDGGYILSTGNLVGVIAEVKSATAANKRFSNLHAKNLVVCSTGEQMGSLFGRVQQETTYRTTLSNCTAQNCTVLGKDHAGSLTACVLDTDASYCYSTGCTVISYGKHSGGLFSCTGGTSTFTDCFTDVRLYGSLQTGVFIGSANGTTTFTNCAASGFVDGDTLIGGFIGAVAKLAGANSYATFTNCYTTALVGVNSGEGAAYMGGFIGGIGANGESADVNQGNTYAKFENCYAAGEVGNVHTKMKTPAEMETPNNETFTNGGFVGSIFQSNTVYPVKFTKSYYDKQTTAMREQRIGYFKNQLLPDETQTYPIGVLTTTTTSTAKAATGLTDRTFVLTNYDSSLPEHYPELTAFKEAEKSDTGWKSEEMANTAKAFSLSSTSTVLLDTWDKGLNTATGEMDADNALGETVYCTVRDLTSGFTLTSDNADATANTNTNTWIQVSNSYGETLDRAKVTINDKVYYVLSLKHNNGVFLCDELVPGFEWLLVSNTVEGQTVTRHVRVTPTAAIEAGASKMITKDDPDAYNHRTDVQLFFSTAAKIDAKPQEIQEGGYPKVASGALSDKFSGVEVGTSMSVETGDNATGSKVYVYLREITGFDESGEIKTQPPVGEAPIGWNSTESGTTSYGQAFNGEERLANNDKRYLLTYMWQLADGRVVQDAKIVRTAKVPFAVALNVFHNMDDATLSQYLTAAKATATAVVPAGYTDKLYADGVETDAQKAGAAIALKNAPTALLTESTGNGVDLHQKAEVAWKLKNPSNDFIAGVTLTMDLIKNAEGETREAYPCTFTTGRDGEPLQNGSKLDMKYTLYRIVYKNGTFYSIPEDIVRTYELVVAPDGTYSLKFDKKGVEGSATNDPDDVFTQEGVDPVYFNDMEFNLRADVVVAHLKWPVSTPTEKPTPAETPAPGSGDETGPDPTAVPTVVPTEKPTPAPTAAPSPAVAPVIPRTADEMPLVPLAVVAALALLAVVVLFVLKKRNRK